MILFFDDWTHMTLMSFQAACVALLLIVLVFETVHRRITRCEEEIRRLYQPARNLSFRTRDSWQIYGLVALVLTVFTCMAFISPPVAAVFMWILVLAAIYACCWLYRYCYLEVKKELASYKDKTTPK